MNTRILEPAQSRAVAEPKPAAARKFPCLAKTRRAGGFALFSAPNKGVVICGADGPGHSILFGPPFFSIEEELGGGYWTRCKDVVRLTFNPPAKPLVELTNEAKPEQAPSFPSVWRNDGIYALATDSEGGIVLASEAGYLRPGNGYLTGAAYETWEESDYEPITEPVTIEFSTDEDGELQAKVVSLNEGFISADVINSAIGMAIRGSAQASVAHMAAAIAATPAVQPEWPKLIVNADGSYALALSEDEWIFLHSTTTEYSVGHRGFGPEFTACGWRVTNEPTRITWSLPASSVEGQEAFPSLWRSKSSGVTVLATDEHAGYALTTGKNCIGFPVYRVGEKFEFMSDATFPSHSVWERITGPVTIEFNARLS
jgi:hypothetical protein